MEENMNVIVEDQTKLAESVSDKINFDTVRSFLVKPLDPVMVKKEFSTPKPANEVPTTDGNGVKATDYAEVETEVKEVESDYRRGVVLKVPTEYQRAMTDAKFPAAKIEVGNIIIYKERNASWFDQLKDSQIIDCYSIFAIEK